MKCLTETASGAAPNHLADGTSLVLGQSPELKMFKIATHPIIAGSILCGYANSYPDPTGSFRLVRFGGKSILVGANVCHCWAGAS